MNFIHQQKRSIILVNDSNKNQQNKRNFISNVEYQHKTSFSNNAYSIMPLSTSNISTTTINHDDSIRRIVKQEIGFVLEEINRNNKNVQKIMEQNVEGIMKWTKQALDDTANRVQKQTSEKLDIILGGIRKAMLQIKKQIKIEISNQMSFVSENKTIKDVVEKVRQIEDKMLKHQQFQAIRKKLQLFNQSKVLQNQGSSTSIKNFRPLSMASIQFKQKKMTKKSNNNQSMKFIHDPIMNKSLERSENQSRHHLNYQVDCEGRLQDSNGHYLINQNQEFVYVKEEHFKILKKFNMLIQ